MSELTMARKTKKVAKAARPVRMLGIRVSPEYGEWLERLARHNRSTMSVLIDQSVGAWAKSTGFAEPPPER